MFYIWYKFRLYRDCTHTTEQTCNSYFCYLGRLCTCGSWCCGRNCRWEMCWTAEQCSILRWCCVLQWSHPWVSCCLCLQLHPPFGGSQIQRMSKKWKLEWYCSTVCCWLVVCHLLCAEPLQYGWSNQSLSAHNFIALCNVSVPYRTFFCLFVQCPALYSYAWRRSYICGTRNIAQSNEVVCTQRLIWLFVHKYSRIIIA